MILFSSVRDRWARAGWIVITLAILAFCAAGFLPRADNGRSPSVLLTLVLGALSAAIALHVRFLLLARRAHGETARVLDATEREFQSIFDNTLDAIVILDDRGICREANPAALDLFGIEREKFVGHRMGRFCLAASGFPNPAAQFFGQNSGHGEIELLRPNGEILVAEYTVKANYLPARHVAVLRDISRRREVERALRESDERYRQIAANIQEIFWMIDTDSKHVISVNEAFETITGRSLDTLRDNPTSYQELFHPEDRIRVLTRLEEAGETGQINEEFRIIRPDRRYAGCRCTAFR
jgi:PAS domain S-box-containing protein